MSIVKKIYKFLSSYKLAMILLVTILACCVAGVTIFRGEEAWNLIFNTLWFNGILVLLVVNVACCFFGRIWGRKLTLISAGMILFHLSFVSILGGIIYNSLFYFRGVIRLTEGEALPSGDPMSYDSANLGRFFSFSSLKGETTLIKMHAGYKVGSVDKRAAYEIEVGENDAKKHAIIYITKGLKYNGFRYFNDKEGYSVRTHLYDKRGRDIFAAHIPLQSLLQEDDTYFYTTGTKDYPGSLHFPQGRLKPLFNLQVAYFPDPEKERGGGVYFKVIPLKMKHASGEVESFAEGRALIGERFDIGDYYLSVQEIRYWVGMTVRYDPGLPIVLTSLWVGFGGIVITFIGRLRRRRK